jgi:hypothetical protein
MGAALGEAKASTFGGSPLQSMLSDWGISMLRQTRPIRKEVLGQLTEALRTGGVKANIPMIQQAVARANQATAGAMTQTAEQLASRNIGGPFAQRILAGMRMAGNEQAAQIPTQMAQSLINAFLPFAGQVQSLGMGAFSTAAQSAQQLGEFNAAQTQQQVLQGGLFGGGRIAGIL